VVSGVDRLGRRLGRRRVLGGMVGIGLGLAAPQILVKAGEPGRARGRVFHDRDGDGRYGAGDVGVGGVAVSNGRDIAVSDESGGWELPLLEGPWTDLRVSKPRGWRVAVDGSWLPRHSYLHQPGGSPSQRYAGLAPTGGLPDSIDFPLVPQEEGERFRALICGDPQPRDLREVDFLARSVPAPLRAALDEVGGGAFGVSLGDISFDKLDLYPAINGVFGGVGVPWHNVLGNHDLNFDSRDDLHARETFRSVYGATYYSFDHGAVHFVVLDNIQWTGADPGVEGSRGSYRGGLGERQLQWLEADLGLVDKDRPVVLFLHIPLRDEGAESASAVTRDRRKLYELLEGREHTLSFSAHRHHHKLDWIGGEDGWKGLGAHRHQVVGTLCGSWFRGLPWKDGVPNGVMSDGTPRGFVAADFDGTRCEIDGYRVLGGGGGQQMHVHVADEVKGGEALHVNYYAGSAASTVRVRVGGGGEWRELERVEAQDPAFVELREGEGELGEPWRTLPGASICHHLWRGEIPTGLAAGSHLVEVEAEDGMGHRHLGGRTVRVG